MPNGTPLGSSEFTPPHIGLDGVWRDVPYRRDYEPFDPFSKVGAAGTPRPLPFREFFPYELSADGTRARVGWLEQYQGVRSTSDSFDVEVRKVAGTWIPVECRQVADTWGLAGGHLRTPVRPLRRMD